MSRKLQITLEDDQYAILNELAHRTRISMAEHIRMLIDKEHRPNARPTLGGFMSRKVVLVASADLRSICRPAGSGRAGEGDLIGVSRRSGCTDTEASLASPPRLYPGMRGRHDVRRHRRAQARARGRAAR